MTPLPSGLIRMKVPLVTLPNVASSDKSSMSASGLGWGFTAGAILTGCSSGSLSTPSPGNRMSTLSKVTSTSVTFFGSVANVWLIDTFYF